MLWRSAYRNPPTQPLRGSSRAILRAWKNCSGKTTVAFGVSQVVVVEMREVATQLVKLLAAFVMAEVNVHFAYPLLDPSTWICSNRAARGRHGMRVVRAQGRRIQNAEPGRHYTIGKREADALSF